MWQEGHTHSEADIKEVGSKEDWTVSILNHMEFQLEENGKWSISGVRNFQSR